VGIGQVGIGRGESVLRGRYGFGWMLLGWIAVALLLIAMVLLGAMFVAYFP
jgi:hypothetical protein